MPGLDRIINFRSIESRDEDALNIDIWAQVLQAFDGEQFGAAGSLLTIDAQQVRTWRIRWREDVAAEAATLRKKVVTDQDGRTWDVSGVTEEAGQRRRWQVIQASSATADN